VRVKAGNLQRFGCSCHCGAVRWRHLATLPASIEGSGQVLDRGTR
jgi:hypothetical protein